MPEIMVSVNIDIDEFDEDDIIEYLGECGYVVMSEYDFEEEVRERTLTEEEMNVVVELVRDATPGTTEYNIYEKLRKR